MIRFDIRIARDCADSLDLIGSNGTKGLVYV